MKINLGSGLTRIDGFVNVDSDALCNPDYVVDIEKENLPFEDSSVDAIVAHHILEHLGDGFLHVMKEMYRVCKDGALVSIRVPHHRHEHFFNDPTHRRPITVETIRMFSKKYNLLMQERTGSWSGFGMVLDVDYEVIDYELVPDGAYQELADKGDWQQLDELSFRFNNVFCETVIKAMVIKDA